jgi:alpha-beta hydrolase superfamily lysophospholipase
MRLSSRGASMSLIDQQASVVAWNEPAGLAPRGTLIVIPGRGELPALYERLGRRLASDAYRVRVVADPTTDTAPVQAQIADYLSDPGSPAPRVLVGSDTGALFAIILATSGDFPGVDAVVLAGLPSTAQPAAGGRSRAGGDAWVEELDIRTFCSAHRARLSALTLRRGALYEPVPDGWAERADLSAVTVPILGLHGSDDPVSPLASARARYAAAGSAELVSIAGGRHDALNDRDHRTAAATIVLFLERIRRDGGAAPILEREELAQS